MVDQVKMVEEGAGDSDVRATDCQEWAALRAGYGSG